MASQPVTWLTVLRGLNGITACYSVNSLRGLSGAWLRLLRGLMASQPVTH